MGPNPYIDEASEEHPNFLKIDNVEIKDLPDVSVAITEFGKIRKSEWLSRKRDKRFRKK